MRKGERLEGWTVRAIRRQHKKPGWSYRRLAHAWSVSHMTIARIVRGETYKGVK